MLGITYPHDKADAPDLYNGTGLEADSDAVDQGNWRYDANGCLTHSPRLQELGYSFDSQPDYVDMGGGTEVRYRRHGDQRVLRLVRKNGARSLGVYLGPWEYHQRVGTSPRAKAVLHVDGAGKHAQCEVVLGGTDADAVDIWFVHSDHLGSGHVLTDASGDLLSQEEFLPYGRSSDRRDARNRYRFIGVERDEATGLCMTGPRTYDPVVGRFLQGDPLVGARSPFEYSSSNPLRKRDANGYQDLDARPDPTGNSRVAGEEQTSTQSLPTAQTTETPTESAPKTTEELLHPLLELDWTTGTNTTKMRHSLRQGGVVEGPAALGGRTPVNRWSVLGVDLPRSTAGRRSLWGVDLGPTVVDPRSPNPTHTIVHEGTHSLIAEDGPVRDIAYQIAERQFDGDMFKATEGVSYYVEGVVEARAVATHALSEIDSSLPQKLQTSATQNARLMYEDALDMTSIEIAGQRKETSVPSSLSELYQGAAQEALGLDTLDFIDLPAFGEMIQRRHQ